MDLLRRDHAPLSDEAWKAIDQAVTQIAKRTLAARRIATFDGPHGFGHVAVPLGTASPRPTQEGQAQVSVPDVILLQEIRASFALSWAVLDALERGAPALEADPGEDAAREVAHAEDRLAFYGEPGGQGFLTSGESPRVAAGDWAQPGQLVGDVLKAVEKVDELGIPGPYELVLPPARYFAYLRAAQSGYPSERHLRDRIAAVHRGPMIREAGALFSTRGDDFILTVGGDLSVGYRSHDRDGVLLFCVESVAAQTLTPEAVCLLTG
jgi:uncharacterized linocin/CFP29 family protein